MTESDWKKGRAGEWSAAIGANVRAERERAKLTQAELGARAGMVAAVLSRLESGAHLPSLASLLRVAEALGVDPGVLLRRKPK